MKNKNKVEVTIIALNKAGVLSSLMMKGSSLGLVYRRKETEEMKNGNLRIKISFYGSLNCDKQQSIKVLEEHAGVLKVERISITDANDEIR